MRLMPSEIKVAYYLCLGLKSKDIASRLHISIKTVKNHLVSIYRKLGVSKRINAITIMMSWDERTLRASVLT